MGIVGISRAHFMTKRARKALMSFYPSALEVAPLYLETHSGYEKSIPAALTSTGLLAEGVVRVASAAITSKLQNPQRRGAKEEDSCILHHLASKGWRDRRCIGQPQATCTRSVALNRIPPPFGNATW